MVIGTLSTAFLQSSSLVSLIVVAFVGAGMLPLHNALGVIFGANLGTTITGWLVTALGFKLDLEDYTLAIIALGSLGFVASKRDSPSYHRFAIVFGLGLLLIGLMWMKSAMAFVSGWVDPGLFQDYPLVVYFLAGVLVTALIQSSSATMVIILSAMYAGLIPLTTAAALVVGSDLGTTSTVLLGALRASNSARRVALAHFTFNLTIDCLALILLLPLLALVTRTIGISDPMYQLVCFHSLFNLLGIILFLPFTSGFARWLERRFQDPRTKTSRLATTPPSVPEAALRAIHDEAVDLCLKTILLNIRALKASTPSLVQGSRIHTVNQYLSKRALSYEDQYQDIKASETEILQYSHRLAGTALGPAEQATLAELLGAVREATYSAKSLKDVRGNLLDLRNQADAEALLTEIRNRSLKSYQTLVNILEQAHPALNDEHFSRIRADIAESHERLHEQMNSYSRSGHNELSLSTLFNINRELFVSNQSITDAILHLNTSQALTAGRQEQALA
ncbi:MAG TPA: hypothetical protein DIT58_11500 [Porticoccaceae bacterium]|nr:hypothetical protein [Porticoccaceae bacterium]